MTPQSSFMILAAVNPEREAELRGLLDSMNDAPGRTNPDNALLPFRQFDTLHFMRLLIVDDKTVDDVRVYGMAPRTYPLYLALAGDIDGDVDAFLAEMARARAGWLAGDLLVLRRIRRRRRPRQVDAGAQRAECRQLRELAGPDRAAGPRRGCVARRARTAHRERIRAARRTAGTGDSCDAAASRLGGRGSRTTDAVPRASDAARLAASQSPPSRRPPRARPARTAPPCSRLRSSSSYVSAVWRRRIPSYVRGPRRSITPRWPCSRITASRISSRRWAA